MHSMMSVGGQLWVIGRTGGGERRTSTDVGVDVVCAEEHGLAWLQVDHVQEEDDEQANVARELAVQTRYELGKRFAARRGSWLAAREALVLFLHLCKKLFACGFDVFVFRVHELAERLLQRLLQLVFRLWAILDRCLEFGRNLLSYQISERLDCLEEVRHFLQWPETAHALKGCDRDRHLGLVVVVLVLFGVLLV
jgi:hypothetical protein